MITRSPRHHEYITGEQISEYYISRINFLKQQSYIGTEGCFWILNSFCQYSLCLGLYQVIGTESYPAIIWDMYLPLHAFILLIGPWEMW